MKAAELTTKHDLCRQELSSLLWSYWCRYKNTRWLWSETNQSLGKLQWGSGIQLNSKTKFRAYIHIKWRTPICIYQCRWCFSLKRALIYHYDVDATIFQLKLQSKCGKTAWLKLAGNECMANPVLCRSLQQCSQVLKRNLFSRFTLLQQPSGTVSNILVCQVVNLRLHN